MDRKNRLGESEAVVELLQVLDHLIEWPDRVPISALAVVNTAKVEAAYRALCILRDMKHDLETKAFRHGDYNPGKDPRNRTAR